MKLFIVTKQTDAGQCYFDFENNLWYPKLGPRSLTDDPQRAVDMKELFEHQDAKVHAFTIEVPERQHVKVHDSCFLPGVPG